MELSVYHLNVLNKTHREQLIRYIDNLVFHGLLAKNDGWRLRSIMFHAHPQLHLPLRLEAFALSSHQCFSVSRGFFVINSLPIALSSAVSLHHARGEISDADFAHFSNAIATTPPAAMPFVEQHFYRRLLELM